MSKTETLLSKIQNQIISDFNFKINDLLSLCDSEIEKLMILNLLSFFQTDKITSWINTFEIEFILDEIFLHAYNEHDKSNLLRIIEKKGYWKTNSCYCKFIGIKIKENVFESSIEKYKGGSFLKENMKKEYWEGDIIREFYLFPQHTILHSKKKYYVDIVLMLKRVKNEKIISTHKIGIECDGYDFHSSPKQKREDDIRERVLKENGIKQILRYSGSEIFNLNPTSIKEIFDQITEIYYQ